MVERFLVTDRATWLERRRRAVNASEVGALFGRHAYQTELGLYVDKSGRVPPKKFDNAVLRRGRLLEGSVAEAVREERPDWQITKANQYLFRSLRNNVFDGQSTPVGIGATPDFIVECPKRGRGVLQAKTALPSVFEADWSPTVPPLWIILQVQQEMLLEGVSWGAIAVLVVDPWSWPIHIYELKAHAGTHEILLSHVTRFWEHLDKGEEPAPDYARDSETLKSLYPRDNGEILDLSGDNYMNELIGNYESAKAALKARAADEKALKTIETEIKAKIGNALGARGSDWEAHMPTIERKGYVVEGTSYRMLKVKRIA